MASEPEDRTGWPPPTRAAVARKSPGEDHHNTLKLGYCFLYVQVYTDHMNEVIPDTSYSIRGLATGYSASGKTDSEGVLRHERLPDDHYEITCKGKTEPLELLFHHHRAQHEERPWALRLRGAEGGGST